jgi:hypothetical protein
LRLDRLDRRDQARIDDDGFRLAVVEIVEIVLGLQHCVDGQRYRAHLHAAQEQCDEIRPVEHAHHHAVAGGEAEALQRVASAADPRVKLGIGNIAVIQPVRGGAGAAGRCRMREQIVHDIADGRGFRCRHRSSSLTFHIFTHA